MVDLESRLTLTTPMSNRQRNNPDFPQITRFQQRALRGALLEVTGDLARRPFPEDTWDRLGRPHCELESLWIDKPVELCRAALAAAQAEGPAVFAATRARVERFFTVLQAEAMVGFETRSASDLAAQILTLTHETTEVIVACAEVSHVTSDAALAHLRDEAISLEPVVEGVIALTSERLATRPRSLART